jgi:nicotinate-nucleotide adenylyltransferase
MNEVPLDLAILGGTFDPVHSGHLQVARVVSDLLSARVCCVPSNIPPHKSSTIATPEQRLTMLRLAVSEHPALYVDDLELKRGDRSFTLETLKIFRRRLGPAPRLYFILGMDAYQSLPSWLGWQQLLDYVHLVVCRRETGQVSAPPLRTLETSHQVETAGMLKSKAHGGLFFVDNTSISVSSTEIRMRIKNKDDPSALLDPAVYAYILQEQLYAAS